MLQDQNKTLHFYRLETVAELYDGFQVFCQQKLPEPARERPDKSGWIKDPLEGSPLEMKIHPLTLDEPLIREALAEANALVECPLVTAARILNDRFWPGDLAPVVVGATYLLKFQDTDDEDKIRLYWNFPSKSNPESGVGLTNAPALFVGAGADAVASVLARLWTRADNWPPELWHPASCLELPNYQAVYERMKAFVGPSKDPRPPRAFALSGKYQALVENHLDPKHKDFKKDFQDTFSSLKHPRLGLQRWFHTKTKKVAGSAGDCVNLSEGVPGTLLLTAQATLESDIGRKLVTGFLSRWNAFTAWHAYTSHQTDVNHFWDMRFVPVDHAANPENFQRAIRFTQAVRLLEEHYGLPAESRYLTETLKARHFRPLRCEGEAANWQTHLDHICTMYRERINYRVAEIDRAERNAAPYDGKARNPVRQEYQQQLERLREWLERFKVRVRSSIEQEETLGRLGAIAQVGLKFDEARKKYLQQLLQSNIDMVSLSLRVLLQADKQTSGPFEVADGSD